MNLKRETTMIRKLAILTALLGAFFTTQVAFAGLEEDRAKADAYLESGDEKKAFKQYRELARDGDYDSQFMVAEMYATGLGTKTDMYDAYGWATLAAESESAEAKAYSEELLTKVEDKDKAIRESLKLKNKYGKEALQAKANRYAEHGATGARAGACTGSRLSCNRRVEAISISPTAGGTVGGGPAPRPGGGN
jgi:TPR repeat protein